MNRAKKKYWESKVGAWTYLFFEVLLEAGLVGELPEAVGALEGHALAAPGAAPSGAPAAPGMRGLHVVVQEALLGEVLQWRGKN